MVPQHQWSHEVKHWFSLYTVLISITGKLLLCNATDNHFLRKALLPPSKKLLGLNLLDIWGLFEGLDIRFFPACLVSIWTHSILCLNSVHSFLKDSLIFLSFFPLYWNEWSLGSKSFCLVTIHQRVNKLNMPPQDNSPNIHEISYDPNLFFLFIHSIFSLWWNFGIRVMLHLSHTSDQHTHTHYHEPHSSFFCTAEQSHTFSCRNVSLVSFLII